MRQAFTEYLTAIQMPGPIVQRVGHFCDLYTGLLGKEPERIFVSDHLLADGSHYFDSLWFFEGDLAMEAHRFVEDEVFDLTRFESIAYWRIEKTDYEIGALGAPDDRSRLKIEFASRENSGDLRATGLNCEYLWTLIREWFVPRSTAPTRAAADPSRTQPRG